MVEEEIQFASMKDVKVGRFVLIEGVACKVVAIDVSAPGKHGSAKMRVTGIGIFDGQKKTLLKPGDADVEVPVIKKKKAQVVSVSGNSAQIMDSETFEVYEIPIAEEFAGKLSAGIEVEIMEAMGRRALSKIGG